MTTRHSLAAAAVVVAYLLLGVGFALRTPIWQNPDEPAHYNYVRSLATGRGLPILESGAWDNGRLNALTAAHFPTGAAIDWMTYEAHQPPLYYALAAPILVAAVDLPVADQVHLLRLFSVLLGTIGILTAFAIGRELFPKRPWFGVAVPAFLVAVPQHVAVIASINNDVLAEVVFSLVLLALIQTYRPLSGATLTWRRRSALGVLLGLTLLTKTTIYAVVALIPLGLVLRHLRLGDDGGRSESALFAPVGLLLSTFSRIRADLAAINVVAIAVAGWWFVRNAAVYGGLDLLGWRRHDLIVVGQPRTVLDLVALERFVVLTFQSFWAQLGWMAVPAQPNDYWALAAIVVVAALGLIALAASHVSSRGGGQPKPLALFLAGESGDSGFWRLDQRQRLGLALLGLGFLLIFGQLAWYNLKFVQPQGRYLFPAIVAIAMFWCLGIAEVLRAPRLRPLAIALVFVAALFGFWQLRALLPTGAGLVQMGLVGVLGLAALASLATLVGRLRWSWAPPALLVCAFSLFDLTALLHFLSFL